jgi:tetratricopeptide (TPR) repeat protein
VRLDPENAEMHLRLMNTLLDYDDVEWALRETREVARLGPGFTRPEFLTPVVTWMNNLGEKDSALAVCREMVNSDHFKRDGHSCLGDVQLNGYPPDFEGAIAEYREAIGIDPDEPNTHHSLAVVLYLDGQHSAALDEYRRAHELAPDASAFKADYDRALRELQPPRP